MAGIPSWLVASPREYADGTTGGRMPGSCSYPYPLEIALEGDAPVFLRR